MKKLFVIGLLMFFFAFITSAVTTESPPVNDDVGITCTINDQDSPAIFPQMSINLQIERGVSVPLVYSICNATPVNYLAIKTEAITNISFNQDFTCPSYDNKKSWQNDTPTYTKNEFLSTQVNNYRAREKV